MFQESDSEDNKVILIAEGQEFYCNREKLSYHSPYFNVMFNGSFVEKTKNFINIHGVTANALKYILIVLNDKTHCIEYGELLNTLQGACMLQFDEIRDFCVSILTDNIRIEFVLKIWDVTEQLDIHPLCEKAKCKAFLEFNKLKESESFLDIDIKQLHSFLSSTFLHCDSEIEVFEAGMRWWHDLSEKFQSTEDILSVETTYLHTIISCVDFNAISKNDVIIMLSYPDITNNSTITELLRGVLYILENNEEVIPEDVKQEAKALINCKKRIKALLPCVVVSGIFEDNSTRNGPVLCDSLFNLSIQCFDEQNKCLQIFFNCHIHLHSRCITSLIGYQIIPYKENLLLLGGEYQYGSSEWNEHIWIYTLREKWEILTKLPKGRRHFSTCIIQDKLFVFGGTGKYRILLNNDMCYYDFITDTWKINIKSPLSLSDAKHCEFRKQLLFLNGSLDNCIAYLLNINTCIWEKLVHTNPLQLEAIYPKQFILFSHQDKIYVKGDHLIEMDLKAEQLELKSCTKELPIYGDKIQFFKNNHKLYICAEHTSNNTIYKLHKYNIETKTLEFSLQLDEPADTYKRIITGCFGYLHYSLTKDNSSISNFNKL